MRVVKFMFVACMALLFTGCAANMPLTKDVKSIDVSQKSIALVSVKISNQNEPKYQPGLMYAFFFPDGKDGEKTHVAIKTTPIKSEENKFNEYLLSFSLKPGTYNFAAIGRFKLQVHHFGPLA